MNDVDNCLDRVGETSELTFNDAIKAYEHADLFTSMGFEVSEPRSFDGETYTITISR